MADSSIERVKQLQKEAAALMNSARKEAMDKINAALAELRDLGFHYFVSEKSSQKRKGRSAPDRKGTRRVKADTVCPICKFKTSPPHDARKHRFTQGKKKKPFSPKELQELGLKKMV